MDDGVAPPAGVDGVLDGACVDAPGARDTGTGERGGVESAVAPSLAQHAALVRESNPSETEPVLAAHPRPRCRCRSRPRPRPRLRLRPRPRLAGGRAAPSRVNFERRSHHAACFASSASQYSRTRLDRTRRPNPTPSTRPTKNRSRVRIARFVFVPLLHGREAARRRRRPGARSGGRSEGGSISRSSSRSGDVGGARPATLGGAPAAAPPSRCTYTSNVIRPSSNDAVSRGSRKDTSACVRSERGGAPPSASASAAAKASKSRRALDSWAATTGTGRRARFPIPARGDRGIARGGSPRPRPWSVAGVATPVGRSSRVPMAVRGTPSRA